MDRRGFFRVLSAMAAIPFLANSSSAKSSERDYVEPFEGYNDYIKKLTGHLEEDSCVQDNFGVIVGGCGITGKGDRKKITELKRVLSENQELFPHEISFSDGLTYNLKLVASITKLSELGYSISNVRPEAEAETTLYLNVPRQEAHNEAMRRHHRYTDEQEKRFGSPWTA